MYASALRRILTLKVLHLQEFMFFISQVQFVCCFYKKPQEVKVRMPVKPDFALGARL